MAEAPAFPGLRGTGDFVTDERPEDWRTGILRLFPNGEMPITGLMSRASTKVTTDPIFHWWTWVLPEQATGITDVFNDSGFVTATTSSTIGDIRYIQLASAANANEYRVGVVVRVFTTANASVGLQGVVTEVSVNGAQSYIAIRLLEIDDNDGGSALLDNTPSGMTVQQVGSSYAEGAQIPDAVTFDPTEFSNVTQIFRYPLELTRTALKTRLRTADSYMRTKFEALKMVGIDMEKSFLWGKRLTLSGGNTINGKPQRFTQGIIDYITTNQSANIFDFTTDDPTYDSTTWLAGGRAFMNEKLEIIFRFGGNHRVAVCGSLALKAINDVAQASSDMQLVTGASSFGTRVSTWITPHGTIDLISHPLLTQSPVWRGMMVVFSFENIRERYIDQLMFLEDPRKKKAVGGGFLGFDGIKEEYLAELGWEFYHPETMAVFYNMGENNA